ncbi:hypothetical protein [Actinocorallia populi]|uniref:hypothetical protein n=1 Tax=Actinocorallia populi TaxID=2079200 RepID=UPI001E29282E|nr:hypothetical protein [Actinocorallia populi]
MREHRSTGDVVAGLLSLLALIALVAGVPTALLRFTGSPLPERVPDGSVFTEPLDTETILYVVTLGVWLAWLQLVVCLLVELHAGVRGIGVPARVPLAGATQAIVHKLVVAVLLLFTATTAIMPAFAAQSPAQQQPYRVTQAAAHEEMRGQHAQGHPEQQRPGSPAQERDGTTAKIYTVQPPHGRHHESLWEIAEKCLGDGRRYKEIFELNKSHVQPDGSRLQQASLIRPGWVMEMPSDARNTEIIPKSKLQDYFRDGNPDPPAAKPKPRPAPERDAAKAAPPAAKPDPRPGTQAPRPDRPGQVHADQRPQQSPAPTPVLEIQPQAQTFPWPEALAGTSLLAAGLLTSLGMRRRAQLTRRRPGHMIPRPEGASALAEQALRIGADAEGARALNLGLRRLSQGLAAQRRTPPTVYGVHLGARSLDLWIAPADEDPPSPWEPHDGGQVWRLHTSALDVLQERDLADVLAPYPGLISLGTNESGRVLADLEAAHGLIAVDGPPEQRKAALAAMAVELATNSWSDHMRLTLVGFGTELQQIAPDRIRCVPSLAEALPELEARTAEVRQALYAAGADSVLTGRCRGVFGEAWMPHYLVTADQPSKADAARLVALARTGQRLSAGYLVAGHVEDATWQWRIDEEGELDAGVLGFQVKAQRVSESEYHAVAGLFRTAGRAEGVPLPAVPPEPPAGSERPAAGIRMLGRVLVEAPGTIDEARRDICAEVLVYLAAHPGGVHPTVLSGAVWPRGVTAGVRDSTIAMAADWLGRDSRGRPNLYSDERGRLRLGSEVRVDLQHFRFLLWRSAAEPASEAAYLSHALELVRGPLLAGRPKGRYSWLATDELEYETVARVVDAAHRLYELRTAEADVRGAVQAARAGLRLAPDDEVLWRDLLRATEATGDRTAVHTVLDELRGRADLDLLQPETEALIEELVPRAHARGA